MKADLGAVAGQVMREGKDITLVAFGKLVGYNLKAAEILAKEGIDCEVAPPSCCSAHAPPQVLSLQTSRSAAGSPSRRNLPSVAPTQFAESPPPCYTGFR